MPKIEKYFFIIIDMSNLQKNTSLGLIQDFFLGGGAPQRDGVTTTNKPHIFLAEYQLH